MADLFKKTQKIGQVHSSSPFLPEINSISIVGSLGLGRVASVGQSSLFFFLLHIPRILNILRIRDSMMLLPGRRSLRVNETTVI